MDDSFGELRLIPITQGDQEGKTLAVWKSSFEASDEEAEAITDAARQVYVERLKGIQDYFQN